MRALVDVEPTSLPHEPRDNRTRRNRNSFAARHRFLFRDCRILRKPLAKLGAVRLLAQQVNHESVRRLICRTGKSLDPPLQLFWNFKARGSHRSHP
jgi:hypothetical protein